MVICYDMRSISCSEYGKATSEFGNAKQAIFVTYCFDQLISRIPKTASSSNKFLRKWFTAAEFFSTKQQCMFFIE
ncbi:hypothetical protein T09_11184 [Trichinella sp. T9]|nr:hypothetical protein T09_11184 [Trichinella sp. T9]